VKGNNLGELEEVVLLAIGALINDAHCEKICIDINSRTNRKLTIGMAHTVLTRLSSKGFITSELGEPSNY
jgi:PadR family transcriptional regulator, regulatory protein PadR